MGNIPGEKPTSGDERDRVKLFDELGKKVLSAAEAQEKIAAKNDAEAKAARLAEEERLRAREKAREEWEQERIKKEEAKRKHMEGWAELQEKVDLDAKIAPILVNGIEKMIDDAVERKEESISLVERRESSYNAPVDFSASKLTGRFIEVHEHRGPSVLDSFLEEFGHPEYREDILYKADEMMEDVAKLYEEKGYRVDMEGEVIKSISWGEEPAEEVKEEPKQPAKKPGIRGIFRSRF